MAEHQVDDSWRGDYSGGWLGDHNKQMHLVRVRKVAIDRGASVEQARLIADAIGRGDFPPGGEARAQGVSALWAQIEAGYDAFMAGGHRRVLYGVGREGYYYKDPSDVRPAYAPQYQQDPLYRRVYETAISRGATQDQAADIVEATHRNNSANAFLAGTDTSVLFGAGPARQAPSDPGDDDRPPDRPPDEDAPTSDYVTSEELEDELAILIAAYAKRDEQDRIDAANRLAVESRQFEQTLALDARRHDERLLFEREMFGSRTELDRLAADIQAAAVQTQAVEAMSTPFASLMGQFQLRAPDEAVTLTPGVGNLLRDRGFPVAGEIPGQPMTITARDVTSDGGQLVRDLMANIGSREFQSLNQDPMEYAQAEVLAGIGGIGRLPFMQALRNRIPTERPIWSSRFQA